MAKQVSIDKIVIQISGKDIELTLEEAKQLRDILSETFGVKAKPLDILDILKNTQRPQKEYVPYPYPVYPLPRPARPYWDRWHVTCDTRPRTEGREQFGTLMLRASSVR